MGLGRARPRAAPTVQVSLALLAVLMQAGAGCQGPPPPSDPRRTAPAKELAVTHTLQNGLKLVVLENRSAPVVAIQLWVRAGSADDPAGKDGLAHVLEHMVFKGTRRRGEGQIAREIEGSGGEINAWTSHDVTVFHLVAASRFVDRALDVLADALLHARFDEAELHRELLVIAEEIKLGTDSPDRRLSQQLFAEAYRRHHYGRPVIGRAETVRRITRDDVEPFFRRYYQPANMTLVVVGDVTPAQALRLAKRRFDAQGGAASAPARPRPAEPEQRRLRIVVDQMDIKEAHVALAFHIPGLIHEDTPVMDLAGIVLGEGESSRLSRRVRDELGLCSDVSAYAYTPRDPGLLLISASGPEETLEAAVEALVAEVLALGHEDVTGDELRRARTIVQSEAVYQRETVQGQARKLGFFESVAGGAAFDQEYTRRIGTATAQDLRRAAGRYLTARNLTLSVVAPGQGQAQAIAATVRAAVDRAAMRVARARTGKTAVSDGVLRVVLDNGARLLVKRDATVPLCSMRALWPGGLRFETDKDNGTSGLIAALLTRGTRSRSGEQIHESIEQMAGAISGFAGSNSLGIQAEVLAAHWEQALEILADCALHPAFSEVELERARRLALEDLQAASDDPAHQVMELFARTLFTRHPYRLSALGRHEVLAQVGPKALRKSFERCCPPGGLVLAVVGDVDPARVEQRFRQLFGRAPGPPAGRPDIPQEPVRTAPERASAPSDKEQVHAVLGFPGATHRGRDPLALEVLAALLGGQGGRLFMELRERKALVYQVNALSVPGPEPGIFAITLALGPEKLPQALAIIDKELARLREQDVPLAELRRVQRYLVGRYEISLQRKAIVASLLAFDEAFGLGHLHYVNYPTEILGVTPGDLRRAAGQYLAPEKQVLVTVGPETLSPGARAKANAAPGKGLRNE